MVGEYRKAKPLYIKALNISKKILGEEHPDTAIIYNNLAELYRSIGEYQKRASLSKSCKKVGTKLFRKRITLEEGKHSLLNRPQIPIN